MIVSIFLILLTVIFKNNVKNYNTLYVGIGYIVLLLATMLLRVNDIYFMLTDNLAYYMLFSGGIAGFIYLLVDFLREKKQPIETYLYFNCAVIVMMEGSWISTMFLFLILILDKDGINISGRRDFIASVLFWGLLLNLDSLSENFHLYVKLMCLTLYFIFSLRNLNHLITTVMLSLSLLYFWGYVSINVFYAFPLFYILASFFHSKEIKDNLCNKSDVFKWLDDLISRKPSSYVNNYDIKINKSHLQYLSKKAEPYKVVNNVSFEVIQIIALVVSMVFMIVWGYGI